MSTLTIRGCDETLSKTLLQESKKRGLSMNKFVLNILEETLLTGKKKRYNDDLEHLAGTWTDEEAEEFALHVKDFEKIDLDEWK